ncbi:endoglucanase IV precursor [Pseudohyphozyma bogoriensis]|nr:endoglucanase IV precursor [Pseudohyphozyma bogoriensis]
MSYIPTIKFQSTEGASGPSLAEVMSALDALVFGPGAAEGVEWDKMFGWQAKLLPAVLDLGRERSVEDEAAVEPAPQKRAHDTLTVDTFEGLNVSVMPRDFFRPKSWGIPTLRYTSASPSLTQLSMGFARQCAWKTKCSDIGGNNAATSVPAEGHLIFGADKKGGNMLPECIGAPIVIFTRLSWIDKDVFPHRNR